MMAKDVFSRYLLAYPLVEATASNTAKVLIDNMTKHAYLQTTLITDKRTAFTSKIIAEITNFFGITLKCAATKHPQTIGKLGRTHAPLKNKLEMASGEYRRQWHNYLPLAVLNHNTTDLSSIGCEPWKVFRFPRTDSLLCPTSQTWKYSQSRFLAYDGICRRITTENANSY